VTEQPTSERPTTTEQLLRDLTPVVLSSLVRRYGDFADCEDALQEALVAAATQWPDEGMPSNPRGWLTTVASRRLIEQWRSDSARRRREATAASLANVDPEIAATSVDDTLTLLILCCHPVLTTPSQVALTLRAVGGLTTAEIARAFLVPESTIAQRISRAKQKIKASGAEFAMPADAELADRMAAVLQVLYLVFNEGYTASSGESLQRVDLTAEAIRLARQLLERLPDDGEVAGLLALMLLTDARRSARTRLDGTLVPLAEQDRSRWNTTAISEGVEIITHALTTTPVGPYQLQAAIAAVHDEAKTADDTDWTEILGLYDLLAAVAPGPMVTLNRAVALAMATSPEAGLRALDQAQDDPALARHHRVDAVRAHLLDLTGDRDAARAAYLLAARRTLSIPEQRYLQSRAAQLSPTADPS
jgi:RNA polymerase sigma factor (sigma-70 family)